VLDSMGTDIGTLRRLTVTFDGYSWLISMSSTAIFALKLRIDGASPGALTPSPDAVVSPVPNVSPVPAKQAT